MVPDQILFPDLVWKGIEEFNRQNYFEAHEFLETAWRAEPESIRTLYQGILQVGVGYFHILHRNRAGALKSFTNARRNLYPWMEAALPIDLPDLIAQMDFAESKLLQDDLAAAVIQCPRIRNLT
jgi:predicted metal-dependent hydrolase